ncbi:uncharacterized protein BCR38DRAFT_528345 [Pseudomassariella vexata]|uniref:Rhodopsin domain-containing protein n=1 Tax=Pseudomassariella vexata TaxID=1141098 RepID=A0A1Y2DCI4_9PEZI|nr:uncharacterized protein BCR38DRAFT_528345 [Pseudomassariella vexata]ORY56971.1 hypothetical protein BCR38DRAFT_528345 [Pseudomassariella vexata]
MYENPTGLIAGSVVMWCITVFCVGLRFGNKIRERQSFLASDWLILAGWVFGTGLTVLEIYGVAIKSLGYRIGATLADPASVTGQLNKARHIQLAFFLMGVTALGLIKLSISCFYWQLFAKVTLRRFLIIWMVIVGVWATAFVMAGLLECGSHLTAVFGTPTEYLKHCGSAVPSGYAMVGSDIATDFITLIIPIPVILRLKMNMRRKLLTLMVFLIGSLSVGASIAKGYIYIRSSMGVYSEDGLLILTGISIWNLAEVEIAIVAACGPMLWSILAPTFSHLASLIGSKWHSRSKINNSKETHELPRFVKMSESQVKLPVGARGVSEGSGERDMMDQYELDSRYERSSIGV